MSKKDLDIIPMKEWFPQGKKPIIVSGPCSAETEEQVITTCTELAKTGKSRYA